jgi:hypothetical protein
MKTLDDVKRVREELKRRLQAAYAAVANREGVVVVTEAERSRFEEICEPKPPRREASSQNEVARHEWIRC